MNKILPIILVVLLSGCSHKDSAEGIELLCVVKNQAEGWRMFNSGIFGLEFTDGDEVIMAESETEKELYYRGEPDRIKICRLEGKRPEECDRMFLISINRKDLTAVISGYAFMECEFHPNVINDLREDWDARRDERALQEKKLREKKRKEQKKLDEKHREEREF